jgi:hypothetical protein
MTIFILCALAWWVIGSASFVFWWTNRYDFTTEEIGMAFMSGLMGPISFFAGWAAFGDECPKRNRVIMKRRV